MESIIETLAEAQRISVEAATLYGNSYLSLVEYITQLNFDATRSALEKSAEAFQRYLVACNLAAQTPLFPFPASVRNTG